MTRIRKILVLGMALTLLTAGLAFGADPIKIGSVLRLSVGAEHGIPSQRGVELAVEQVNKAGGINGRKVEVIFEDEKDSPAASVNAVQKLINVDKVVAIVGPMTSGGMMAAGKSPMTPRWWRSAPPPPPPSSAATATSLPGLFPHRQAGPGPDRLRGQNLEAQDRGHPVLQRAVWQGLRRSLHQVL